MTTRRDRDLPSHPSTSPGGRPRIPEREITDTDVTQHAQEVLTDQDFLITSPGGGDYFRYDGSEWVNQTGVPFTDLTGSIANAQVPEAAVTQHQAALAIAESQIPDGGLLARLSDNETISGNWTFHTDSTTAFDGTVSFSGVLSIPESSVTAHEAALSIAFTQLTGSIANGQVPQSAVTQHEAALTILESQITDGSILARLAAAETITGAWTFSNNLLFTNATWLNWENSVGSAKNVLRMTSNDGVKLQNPGGDIFIAAGGTTTVMQISDSGPVLRLRDATGELLRLDDSSATGSPFMAFYQNGTYRGEVGYDDGLGTMFLDSEDGPWVLRGPGDNILNLRTVSATANPYMAFYQAGTRRAYIQFLDANARLRFVSQQTGEYEFLNSGASSRVFLIKDSTPALHVSNVSGELLRLDDSSATGSPKLTFYQSGTQRAYVEWMDSVNDLRITALESGSNVRLYAAGSLTAYFRYGVNPTLRLYGGGNDEILQLRGSGATDSPYLSFFQGGTRRAYLRYLDSGDVFRIVNEGGTTRVWEFQTDGDFVSPGDVIATVP